MLRRSVALNVFVFTQQNAVLANNAKHLGFKSNVWVEEEDAWWWQKATQLKPDQRATETKVQRFIEYYNLDSLQNKAALEADLPTNEQSATGGYHTSFRTKTPFSGSLGKNFEKAAELHGYKSKFWISAQEVRKNKHPLVRGSKPTSVVFPTTGRLFNADQFVAPDAITKCPVSGMKRKPYGGDFRAALEKDIAANKYSTGLYFTLNQLEHFGLASDLRPNAMPVQLHLTQLRGNLKFFSLDEVEGGERLLGELQRFPVEEHTFIISGRPVRDEKTLEIMKKRKAGTSKYWISQTDLATRQYAVKEGAEGIPFQGGQAASQLTVLMYNADQLLKPEVAFTVAGTKGQL